MPDLAVLQALPGTVVALPALPEVITEVLRALGREEVSANRSIELIGQDQALAASTLRLANSAFYGVPGRVASIGDAVRMLGLRTVCGVLTAVATHNALRVDRCPAFRFHDYWRHAIGAALAARALATRAGGDADEAFLAGLMHDVGQLVLAACHPELATEVLALARARGSAAHEAEAELLGTTHAHIGSQVLSRWHLPAPVVVAVRDHHDAAATTPVPGLPVALAGLVAAASALADEADRQAEPAADAEPTEGTGTAGAAACPPRAAATCTSLGMADSEVWLLVADVARDMREICELLNAAPARR